MDLSQQIRELATLLGISPEAIDDFCKKVDECSRKVAESDIKANETFITPFVDNDNAPAYNELVQPFRVFLNFSGHFRRETTTWNVRLFLYELPNNSHAQPPTGPQETNATLESGSQHRGKWTAQLEVNYDTYYRLVTKLVDANGTIISDTAYKLAFRTKPN